MWLHNKQMSQEVFICISSQPYQSFYIVNILWLPTTSELAGECSEHGVNAVSEWPLLCVEIMDFMMEIIVHLQSNYEVV